MTFPGLSQLSSHFRVEMVPNKFARRTEMQINNEQNRRSGMNVVKFIKVN